MFPDYWYKLHFVLPDNKTDIDIVMIDTVLLCGNSDDDRLHLQPDGADDPGKKDKQLKWIEKQLKESTYVHKIQSKNNPNVIFIEPY